MNKFGVKLEREHVDEQKGIPVMDELGKCEEVVLTEA